MPMHVKSFPSRNGIRHRRLFATTFWPLAGNTRTMLCSLMTLRLDSQTNSDWQMNFGNWSVGHLECLLNSIPVDVFASKQSLQWIAKVVSHVLGPDACPEDIRAATVVQWLVERSRRKRPCSHDSTLHLARNPR